MQNLLKVVKGAKEAKDTTAARMGGGINVNAAVNAAEKHIPEDSSLHKLLEVFNRVTPPYTLSAIGSSAFLSPLAHACARAVLAMAFLFVGVAAIRNGASFAIPVCLVYTALFFMLSFSSILYRIQIGTHGDGGIASAWLNVREASVMGLLYQCLASVALWMFPIAIFAATRNLAKGGRARNHVLKYAAHGMPFGAFIIDCIILGTTPNFPWFGVVPPIILEGILIFVGYQMNKIPVPSKLVGDNTEKLLRILAKSIVVILILGGILTAVFAVFLSRASHLCRNNRLNDEVKIDEESGADDDSHSTTQVENERQVTTEIENSDNNREN